MKVKITLDGVRREVDIAWPPSLFDIAEAERLLGTERFIQLGMFEHIAVAVWRALRNELLVPYNDDFLKRLGADIELEDTEAPVPFDASANQTSEVPSA